MSINNLIRLVQHHVIDKAVLLNFVNENGFNSSLRVHHIQREDDKFKYDRSECGKQYASFIEQFHFQLTNKNAPHDPKQHSHKFYYAMSQFLGKSCTGKKETLSNKFVDRLKKMRKTLGLLIKNGFIKISEDEEIDGYNWIIVRHRDEKEREGLTNPNDTELDTERSDEQSDNYCSEDYSDDDMDIDSNHNQKSSPQKGGFIDLADSDSE